MNSHLPVVEAYTVHPSNILFNRPTFWQTFHILIVPNYLYLDVVLSTVLWGVGGVGDDAMLHVRKAEQGIEKDRSLLRRPVEERHVQVLLILNPVLAHVVRETVCCHLGQSGATVPLVSIGVWSIDDRCGIGRVTDDSGQV